MSTWTRHDQYGRMDTCTLTVSRPSAVDLGQCWTRYAVRCGSHVPPRAGRDANGPRCVPSCGPRYGQMLKLHTRGAVQKPSVGMNGPRRHSLLSGARPSTRSAWTLRPEYLYAHMQSYCPKTLLDALALRSPLGTLPAQRDVTRLGLSRARTTKACTACSGPCSVRSTFTEQLSMNIIVSTRDCSTE